MSTLPNKLSDLLELAVRDAQACEAEPKKFKLAMGHWLTEDRGVCLVCMAGAVMVKTLGVTVDRNKEQHPSTTGYRPQLFAIDSMRIGDFVDAADELGIDAKTSERARDAIHRCESTIAAHRSEELRRASWGAYLECANVLREAGL
jgi:hypothetical protein